MSTPLQIAYAFNLKSSDAVEEAEYDTQATVDRILKALATTGHEIHPLNLNGSLAKIAARLEDLAPDLIFNTAEGRRGRLRAGFFPALFEHLGIPYTGSDSLSCALTLDKHATKERVASHGVPTPRAILVSSSTPRKEWLKSVRTLPLPVIAKPNYEGSSIGVSTDSVFEAAAALEKALPDLLERFPAGIIVEEFIRGRDVTVGYLEALAPPVLEPTGYAYSSREPNPYNLYDYRLKNHASDEVQVLADPGLDPALAGTIREWAGVSARALELHDCGRFDFRISTEGKGYFLEANAIPSLEEGAGLLLQAEKRGLSYDETIAAIVESAVRRQGVRRRKSSARGSPRPEAPARFRRVGVVYNLKRSDAGEDDSEAEFDSPKTIAGLESAIVDLGYEAVELEALRDLPARLLDARPDLVFNIAEGRRGRNRESQVPALCELLGLPHTGSDAMTLGMCLDKSIAKRLLLQSGLPTPRFILMRTGREKLPLDLRFPLIAKPNAEGTSKGLGAKSVVEDEGSLRLLVKELIARYRQPVIVEEYIAGREITVGLLGWPKPRMLAPMEVHLAEPGVKHPVYHYRLKLDFTEHTRFECPARLTPEEVARIEKVARAAYDLLGCLDVTRLDFRLSPGGVPNLIEINPLPGLSPGFSDLALIAEGSGLAYKDLIAEILKGAIARASRSARPSSEEGRIPWRTAAPSFEG